MARNITPESGEVARADYGFHTTHWSVVLAAGGGASKTAHAALDTLCRAYWFPLYAYVRRQGHAPEAAQDLTQEFFLRLIDKQSIRLADSARGKFRTFLLTALKNFLINEWEKARTAKRGNGQASFSLEFDDAEQRYLAEPASDLTPDRLFDRRWAIAVVERAQEGLRREYTAAQKLDLFDALKNSVWGNGDASYAELATFRGTTAGALRTEASRMRERFRTLLREEVAHTAQSLDEVDDELRYLVSLLRS